MNKFFEKIKKLKEGLIKSKENLSTKINTILSKHKLDESILEEIEEILLLSDMGYETSEKIIKYCKEKVLKQKEFSKEFIIQTLKEKMLNILENVNQTNSGIDFEKFEIKDAIKPKVIVIVGVNGTGKTTSIGKIAYQFKINNNSVLIGAADTFRAAANEQLKIWAERADVDIIDEKYLKDPGAVAYETIETAIKNKIDIVLIDTAGRLHTTKHLMDELAKINRVIEKKLNRSADEIFLVIDASTGQNAVIQIESFLKYVPITGIILTKLDGTAKGGIIFQIVDKFKIPIKFVGIGEGIKDLQPFDAKLYIDAIFED